MAQCGTPSAVAGNKVGVYPFLGRAKSHRQTQLCVSALYQFVPANKKLKYYTAARRFCAISRSDISESRKEYVTARPLTGGRGRRIGRWNRNLRWGKPEFAGIKAGWRCAVVYIPCRPILQPPIRLLFCRHKAGALPPRTANAQGYSSPISTLRRRTDVNFIQTQHPQNPSP